MSFWKRCSNCKKDIPFNTTYYVCSVTTCNRDRTALQFCSVSCWSAHVPVYRHRESWAEERVSPKGMLQAQTQTPVARSVPASEDDVLIVVSKLKLFIKNRADMNTAGDVADWLSDKVRGLCTDAVRRAREDGRKTVMAKDFE